MNETPGLSRDPGPAFLADLAARGRLTQNVAVVVAHPDDEAIGVGGQLHRFDKLTLIVGSDGAPRDGRDLERTGHANVEAYARTRRAELAQALQPLDKAPRLIRLDLPDGELINAIDTLVATLAAYFDRYRIQVVLTHAYEGGHPDHDALALAVHLAARRCAQPPVLIEMPYYHAGPDGWVLQSFHDECQETCPEFVTLHLGDEAWTRKCAMLAAHRSQAEMLDGFRQHQELFRLAPAHDFTQPPHEGGWLYEQVAPSVTPDAWLERARAAVQSAARA